MNEHFAFRVAAFAARNVRGTIVTSDKFNDWLQIVGLFGVIASLLFVGMELRQAKEIAMSAANQARTDTTMQLVTEMATDPFLRSATLKYQNIIDAPQSDEEAFASRLMAYVTLIMYENIHQQFLQGFITEDRWLATRNTLKSGLRRGGGLVPTRALYEANPNSWNESFRIVVDDIITELEAAGK